MLLSTHKDLWTIGESNPSGMDHKPAHPAIGSPVVFLGTRCWLFKITSEFFLFDEYTLGIADHTWTLHEVVRLADTIKREDAAGDSN